MPHTVLIENATLESLASNPEALAAFPSVLRPILDARSGVRSSCGSCIQKRRRALLQAYDRAKHALAGLDGTQAAKLRQILGAERIRVMVPGSAGRVTPRDI